MAQRQTQAQQRRVCYVLFGARLGVRAVYRNGDTQAKLRSTITGNSDATATTTTTAASSKGAAEATLVRRVGGVGGVGVTKFTKPGYCVDGHGG